MNKTTCQICARNIKANTGIIAHHGYERPGTGWQTASCPGAKALPYEQSRDLIPTVIKQYEGIKQNLIDHANDLMANPPTTIEGAPSRSGTSATYDRPENFNAKANFDNRGYDAGNYGRRHYLVVCEVRSNIQGVSGEIARLKKRYEDWKPQA